MLTLTPASELRGMRSEWPEGVQSESSQLGAADMPASNLARVTGKSRETRLTGCVVGVLLEIERLWLNTTD